MTGIIERTIGPIDALLAREDREAIATFHPGETNHARTAWILSYTGVSNEPRVLRQAWSLSRRGWNVVVAGFDGHSPRPPEWSFVRLADHARSSAPAFRASLRLQRGLGRLLYSCGGPSPAVQFGARLYYFALPGWRQNHREILRIADGQPHLRGSLVIAHDFHTCPPAAMLAEKWNAAFLVDCHEYGRGQYMDDPQWVKDGRLFASAIQDDYLARADAVTTVCDGIAELLNREQKLQRPVVTVRSMPFNQPQAFRPTGDAVTVLYHGILSADRGLEEAVESLKLWHPRFRLVLRGSGEAPVIERLRHIAHRNGVGDRLVIEPPVPFDRIVPSANAADIGYFVQHDFSPQKRFTLPNKFFEYVMAGLALCVADLPEMARIVERYRLGRLVAKANPAVIAETINALSREQIDSLKRASLAAASELNWEIEQNILLDLVEDIVARKAG